MNRIRFNNGKYEVLITPFNQLDSGMQKFVGEWTNTSFGRFNVKTFDNMRDANELALQMPDVDWNKLVSDHKYCFIDLRNKVKNIINESELILSYEPTLMTSEQIKNLIFERVLKHGQRFTTTRNMNDIISLNISNPWSQNLDELADLIKKELSLKLVSMQRNGNVINFIGKTDIGTTYEINLWPSLIHNWAKWAIARPELSERELNESYVEMSKLQKKIDSSYVLR
jgi:hypothetical protein